MSHRPSTYDAIGHVVCGLLILGACEAAHDGTWLIDRPWPPGRISMYLTMSYSIGQFVALLAGSLVVQRLVRNCLNLPECDHAGAIAEPDETIRPQFGARSASQLWCTLCLGLLVVAAILMGGMLWQGASLSWGQSAWRKLGYAGLALLGAAGSFDWYAKSSRARDVTAPMKSFRSAR
jgi:hypothetical protein